MSEQQYTSQEHDNAPSDALPAAQPPDNPPPTPPQPPTEDGQSGDEVGKADKIMIAATIAIALASIVSAGAIYLQYREMVGGSGDTHTIATAAEKTRIASETSAKAATDFATAASGINTELGAAVDKLNSQADALNKSVTEATRLAKDTEEANSNALDADRPWIGITITVKDFVLNGKPYAEFNTTNSGKRPALVLHTRYATSEYVIFPIFPKYDTAPSSNLLELPGGGSYAKLFLGDDVVTDEGMRQLDVGITHLYVYGDVEYEDTGSHIKHWTHTCMVYSPKTSATDAWFAYCSAYNEADQEPQSQKAN